jgi:hypothetical protein
VLEVVRGRKAAHSRERQLIAEYQPSLNTFWSRGWGVSPKPQKPYSKDP